MPSLTLSVSHRRALDVTRATLETLLPDLAAMLAAPSLHNLDAVYFNADTSSAAMQRAAGLLTLSSGSGSVGADINGVNVVDTWATSDTVSAGLVAAALNASTDALVKGFVGASRYTGTVTCSSVSAGDTVEVFGQTFTASASPVGLNQWSQAGNDTADAAALAVKLNAHPSLCGRLRAVSVAGVVYIAPMRDSAATSNEKLLSSNSTRLAVSQVGLRAACMVWSLTPGVVGNAVTCAASGTGVTFTTLNTGRLGGGIGSNAATGASSGILFGTL